MTSVDEAKRSLLVAAFAQLEATETATEVATMFPVLLKSRIREVTGLCRISEEEMADALAAYAARAP